MVNIADTFSRRERRFVFWGTWLCVALAVAGLAGLAAFARRIADGGAPIHLAGWFMGLTAGVLTVVLAGIVLYVLRHQRGVREEDGTYVDSLRTARRSHAGTMGAVRIHFSFAAYVFGGLSWLVAWCWWSEAWWLLTATLVVGAVIDLWAARHTIRHPEAFRPAMRTAIALAACYGLLALNFGLARAMPWVPDPLQSPGTAVWAGRLPLNVILCGFYLVLYQRACWVHRRVVTRDAASGQSMHSS